MAQNRVFASLTKLLALLACAVILRATASIVWVYRDYFPPNFAAEFLIGRQAYFYGLYGAAFYVHIVAGPICLLAGLALLVDARRGRPARWHKAVGRMTGVLVLLAVAPSGLVMAFRAPGIVSGSGFAALAVVTGASAGLGWRSAVRRRFADHERWMQRTYALLGSAVVLRGIGGAAAVLELEGTYPIAAWVSWLAPLALLEAARFTRR
ncbi:MAG: DUF2306 domain-containing protein [Planctomycetota bacterium]